PLREAATGGRTKDKYFHGPSLPGKSPPAVQETAKLASWFSGDGGKRFLPFLGSGPQQSGNSGLPVRGGSVMGGYCVQSTHKTRSPS
ncbi:hypothetical protein, partial [Limnohabitans sp.]|uniref:hypothetical protein n=1 Tax=Limnohabitans sp. TaxID=1907725 RepID=UPI0035B281F3